MRGYLLNYKKLKFWMLGAAMMVLIAVGVGILSNHKKNADNNINVQAQGPYSIVYLNPIYSGESFANARKDNVYQFNEELFKITSELEADHILVDNPKYRKEKVGKHLAVLGEMTLDVSKYMNRQCFFVFTPDGSDTGYRIYKMDDEVWIGYWRWYGQDKEARWCDYILKIVTD